MRLAAMMETERAADRRGIDAAGTIRDTHGKPCDIEILDISTSGFLAELPEGETLDTGTRVRVATPAIGRHHAVLIRRDGRRHGFVFTRPLSPDAVDAIDANGPQQSNVAPLFAGAIAAPPPESGALSPRASLVLITGLAGSIWMMLGSLLYMTA